MRSTQRIALATIPTIAIALLSAGPASAQVLILAPGVPVIENFDSLSNTGTSSTMPTGWAFSEAGTGANTTYSVGNGSSSTGDTYSFGSGANANERALGTLRTGTLGSTLGAQFRNDTGSPITTVTVSYTGEQWRLGASGRVDRLLFQWSVDATSLTTGTWTGVPALAFETPNIATVGEVDGNANENRRALTATITGLSIPAGAVFFVRWVDAAAVGAEDGLGIDDFSLTTPCLCTDQGAASCGNNGTCSLSGCNNYPAATVCRAKAAECDVAETCAGGGAACAVDGLAQSGTACTDDANPCTRDECDGSSSACQHPAVADGTACPAGVCRGGVCRADGPDATDAVSDGPLDVVAGSGGEAATDGGTDARDSGGGSVGTAGTGGQSGRGAGGGAAAGGTADGGSGRGGTGAAAESDDGGCGCRTPSGGGRGLAALATAFLFGLALSWRRKRASLRRPPKAL